MTEVQQSKIWFANMLRGIAALLVVYRHIFECYWFDAGYNSKLLNDPQFHFPPITTENIFIKFASYTWENFRFAWGTVGVGLFFIISGFVISFSISKRNPLNFLMNRILRIYPVIFFVLFLDLIWLYVYNKIFIHNELFSLDWLNYFYNSSIFLRVIFKSPYIDPVLWTLEIELFFYIIMAFLTQSRISNIKWYLLLYLIILVSTIFLYNLHDINNLLYFIKSALPHLSMMLIGVFFYNYYTQHWKLDIRYIGTVLSLIVIQYLYIYYKDKSFIVYISSYSIALFIWLLFYIFHKKLYYSRVLDFFASISYPLYLSHQVFSYICLTLLLKFFEPYFASVVTFLLTIALAAAISYSVERKSIIWSRKF